MAEFKVHCATVNIISKLRYSCSVVANRNIYIRKNRYSINKMEDETLIKSLEKWAAQEDSETRPDNAMDCLSNETIFGLYKGDLSENIHYEAVSHLAECRGCLIDLQFYSKLMNS